MPAFFVSAILGLPGQSQEMFRLRTDSLKACRNIADLRQLARRRVPAPVFHYIDGAAGDE